MNMGRHILVGAVIMAVLLVVAIYGTIAAVALALAALILPAAVAAFGVFLWGSINNWRKTQVDDAALIAGTLAEALAFTFSAMFLLGASLMCGGLEEGINRLIGVWKNLGEALLVIVLLEILSAPFLWLQKRLALAPAGIKADAKKKPRSSKLLEWTKMLVRVGISLGLVTLSIRLLAGDSGGSWLFILLCLGVWASSSLLDDIEETQRKEFRHY